MDRNPAPSLFKTLNRFEGYSQEFAHLFLRFSELLAQIVELVAVQGLPLRLKWKERFAYTTL
jgi:hypothetical protein